jgi:hypothetical protein
MSTALRELAGNHKADSNIMDILPVNNHNLKNQNKNQQQLII